MTRGDPTQIRQTTAADLVVEHLAATELDAVERGVDLKAQNAILRQMVSVLLEQAHEARQQRRRDQATIAHLRDEARRPAERAA